MSQQKKKSVEQLITDAVNAAVSAVIAALRRILSINHYRAMERLLRNYPISKKRVEDMENYGFYPVGHSSSITVAPPPGASMRDPLDVTEEIIAERKKSYARTDAQFWELDTVVRQFIDKPEFIVIRMYYFNEDAYGNDRGPDSRLYTFEEISEELAAVGIQRSEKTLRGWRTRLVQDMTVVLFGIDGAVSVETRDGPKQE